MASGPASCRNSCAWATGNRRLNVRTSALALPADPVERIVAALHEAAFDAGAWPPATALIDDVCGLQGSQLLVVDAQGPAPRYCFGWFHSHGRVRPDFEREYVRHFPDDQRVARLLMMPAGTMLADADLLSREELAESALHREFLPRWGGTGQLSAQLQIAPGQHVFWMPMRRGGQNQWRTAQMRLLRHLLPHVVHAERCRQAFASCQATSPAEQSSGSVESAPAPTSRSSHGRA